MVSHLNKAVFLDRDGVINEAVIVDGKPYPPPSIGEFIICPGVDIALNALSKAGFLNIIVTNQPDVRTGKQGRNVVDAFHDKLELSRSNLFPILQGSVFP